MAEFMNLPTEIVVEILTYLDYITLNIKLKPVSRRFHTIITTTTATGALAKNLFREKQETSEDNDELRCAGNGVKEGSDEEEDEEQDKQEGKQENKQEDEEEDEGGEKDDEEDTDGEDGDVDDHEEDQHSDVDRYNGIKYSISKMGQFCFDIHPCIRHVMINYQPTITEKVTIHDVGFLIKNPHGEEEFTPITSPQFRHLLSENALSDGALGRNVFGTDRTHNVPFFMCFGPYTEQMTVKDLIFGLFGRMKQASDTRGRFRNIMNDKDFEICKAYFFHGTYQWHGFWVDPFKEMGVQRDFYQECYLVMEVCDNPRREWNSEWLAMGKERFPHLVAHLLK